MLDIRIGFGWTETKGRIKIEKIPGDRRTRSENYIKLFKVIFKFNCQHSFILSYKIK